jgi:hypothetical protein
MKYPILKILMSLTLLIQSGVSFSQVKGKVTDSLTELTYSAYFSDLDGHVTNEQITWRSLGVKWEIDKSQIKCEEKYSPTDSVIRQLNNPKSKRGKEKDIGVRLEVTSGFADNETQFWIHPFRSNQYVYTEIAPFPSIYYENLKVGEKWEEKLFILFGWGKFKGKMKNTYEVIGQTTYDCQGEVIEDCWLIEGSGEHNKLGMSKISYLFHPEFGFLYMKYKIYNGIEMEFFLINKK